MKVFGRPIQSKLFRTCFEIENFHCARTKCEAIVTNVLAPHAEKTLQNELLDRNYVCLSTDACNHGNIKMMPIVVRYFIPTIGIQVKMLELSTVKGETSEIISSYIINTAEKKTSSERSLDLVRTTVPLTSDQVITKEKTTFTTD